MNNTKQLQADLDKLVEKRNHWREMKNIITAPQTKDLMTRFAERIASKRDSYALRYDKCDPTDSNEVAKCQEARSLCNEILNEMDAGNCSKVIDECDRSIKAVSDEIARIGAVSSRPNLYTEQLKASGR